MPGALIRANRPEVTERCPLLGFTVETGGRPFFEVVVTTRPELLARAQRAARTADTFWSSRVLGVLPADRGEAVFLVPDDVLRRFAGSERIYYAFATFADINRSAPQVSPIEDGRVPSVAISSRYAGRRMRQLVGVRGGSARWNGASRDDAGYSGAGSAASLEWAGDAAVPGSEPAVGERAVAPPPSSERGAAAPGAGSVSAGLSYDDGYPDSLWHEETRPGAAALEDTGAGAAFDIGWSDVPLIAEGNGMTCAEAAAAMVAAWRDSAGGAADRLARNGMDRQRDGDTDDAATDEAEALATLYDLTRGSVQSGLGNLRDMLAARGPLWVGAGSGGDHAVVVTGMYGDGTPDATYVRINDPRMRDARSAASAPGAASQYVLPVSQFITEHVPTGGASALAVLHVRPEHLKGRTPIVTSQAYQLWQQVSRTPPRRRAQAQAAPLVVPIAAAITGATMTRILNNDGDVKWELDQMKGLKHPGNDVARTGTAPFQTTSCRIEGWPVVENGMGDEIYADFDIEWQYNGHSLGNVAITPAHTNDALAWGLTVKAIINDDDQVYVGDMAGIRVKITYVFDRTVGSDCIATRSIVLYANGTRYEQSKWTQQPDGWGSEEMSVSRAQNAEILKEIVSPIVNTVLQLLISSAEGDIKYELPQLDNMKYVDDNKANAGGAVQTSSFEVKLPPYQVPIIPGLFSDEISFTMRIDWQHDGRSLGNIRVRKATANDAVSYGLSVKCDVMNDAAAYQVNGSGPTFAAIRLLFTSTYTGLPTESEHVVLTDVVLYGNGLHMVKSTWTQE